MFLCIFFFQLTEKQMELYRVAKACIKGAINYYSLGKGIVQGKNYKTVYESRFFMNITRLKKQLKFLYYLFQLSKEQMRLHIVAEACINGKILLKLFFLIHWEKVQFRIKILKQFESRFFMHIIRLKQLKCSSIFVFHYRKNKLDFIELRKLALKRK